MRARRIGTTVLAVGVVVGLAMAQESQFRPVSNPFQDGYDYRVGDDLVPGVDIEGVRWTLLRLAAKEGHEIEAGKDNTVLADLEFESTRDESVSVLVIVLLEDQEGAPLQRLQLDPIRLAGGRVRADRQRLRLPGDILLATRSVYVFCELQ